MHPGVSASRASDRDRLSQEVRESALQHPLHGAPSGLPLEAVEVSSVVFQDQLQVAHRPAALIRKPVLDQLQPDFHHSIAHARSHGDDSGIPAGPVLILRRDVLEEMGDGIFHAARASP
jgi:hypothetical protein